MAMLVITRWSYIKQYPKTNPWHSIPIQKSIRNQKTDGNMFGDLDWPMAGPMMGVAHENKDWLPLEAFNGWGDMDTKWYETI